jgi:DNA-directed RNA polymerase subunit RPC12/RpoP
MSKYVPTLKAHYSCYRCGHEWKTRLSTQKPIRCPKCTSRFWDKPRVPKPDPTAIGPRIETMSQVVERLLKARADICKTSTHCAIGRDHSGHFHALTPAQQQAWLKLPDHYGQVLMCLSRYLPITAESLERRLFPKQGTDAAA